MRALYIHFPVAPFDQSQMGEVEKAILEANIGLVPNNDGNVIRLNIPALTEDRRKELMKQVRVIVYLLKPHGSHEEKQK